MTQLSLAFPCHLERLHSCRVRPPREPGPTCCSLQSGVSLFQTRLEVCGPQRLSTIWPWTPLLPMSEAPHRCSCEGIIVPRAQAGVRPGGQPSPPDRVRQVAGVPPPASRSAFDKSPDEAGSSRVREADVEIKAKLPHGL